MSAPPTPARARGRLHLVVGAATALLMAATGVVIVPPDIGAALSPPEDRTSAAPNPALVDVMSYPRVAAPSRDMERGLSEQSAKPVTRLGRADEQRSKQRAAKQRQHDQAGNQNRWVLPVKHYSLSAWFGESSWLWSSYHTGLDFNAAYGAPIAAIAAGTVTEATYDGSYGYKTVVTLDDGTEVWYCHQVSLAIPAGTKVSPGDRIGYVGATGNVTGAHLHLEVRPGGGGPVDPFAALVQHGLRP